VVALIELDEVEEISRQVLKPPVGGSLKLVDIGDYNVGFFKVHPVRRGTADLNRLRIRLAVKNATFNVENAKGVRVMQPDLPHPTGNTIPISRSFPSKLVAKLASSA
jgi:hypothetical protein